MPFGLLILLLNAFDGCEADFASAQDPRSAYLCFYFTAQNTNSWKEGARRTRGMIERFPDRSHWLELVLAHILSERDERAAEASYRAAAAGFAEDGVDDGEILARNNLTRVLQRQRRNREAEREIERVLEVAERNGDPALIARAHISEADYLTANGREVARAYRALKRAEEVAFPDGSRGLKRRVLSGLGQVAFATGRLEESVAAYERLLRVLEEEEDTFASAMITFNIAMAKYRQLQYLPSRSGRDEVLGLAALALRAATASENRRAEAFARQLIVELTPHTPATREAVREHAERCVAVARELEHPDRIVGCLLALAELTAEVEGGSGGYDAILTEALELARESETNWYTAYALRTRARISWRTKGVEQAVDDARAALEAVEFLRGLQGEEQGRVELFSDWTHDYYTLSGNLLTGGKLGEAFSVTERMRARVLLESLTAAEALPEIPENPAREAILDEIASLQRRLLDPALEAGARGQALTALERMERDEAELRPTGAVDLARPPDFASLETIQAALHPGEAMLSFQIALWTNVRNAFGGGSWVTVITRDHARAFRLPDRVALAPKIPIFIGLLARRDGNEVRAAAALYDEILAAAVESLPEGIEALVLVPDGALHHLPFAALRAPGSKQSLGETYALSVAPSATLWHRFRRGVPAPGPVPALAWADPTSASAVQGDSAERAVFLGKSVELGSLPYARLEGQSVVDRLGGGSELLVADEASERAVKERDLGRYRILHFAAHALADDENPDRSAVVLSPGRESEDGLLQSREISKLHLDGSIVVLSACQTAAGRTLSGEGVLSLARAFFQAGAHAVVASRWPLRDDEAAVLFDEFYRAVARGASLAESMRAMTRRAVAHGMPPAVWSGLTVYGDGSLAPVRERGNGPGLRRQTLVAAAVLLLLVASVAITAGKRRTASRAPRDHDAP